MKLPRLPFSAPRLHAPSQTTVNALKKIPQIRSFSDILDVAMEVPATRVEAAVRSLVEAHPHATIAELERRATNTYVSRAGLLSGLVGAGAAVPGAGTMIATGLTAGELVTFYANTTLYVLTMANLHGIEPDNLEQRRALVAAALLGDEGAKIVSDQLGLSTLTWARHQLKNMSSPTLNAVNKRLMKYAAKRATTKATSRAVGRLFPFGIGAAVGYFSGRKVAKQVVEGLRLSLGEPREGTAADIARRLDAIEVPHEG